MPPYRDSDRVRAQVSISTPAQENSTLKNMSRVLFFTLPFLRSLSLILERQCEYVQGALLHTTVSSILISASLSGSPITPVHPYLPSLLFDHFGIPLIFDIQQHTQNNAETCHECSPCLLAGHPAHVSQKSTHELTFDTQ